MLINEKGINAAIERKQNEDAQKIKENKKFLTDIVKRMASFETVLHDIIDTCNYCRSYKIDDLLITVFEANNVKVNLGLDIATGKYDFYYKVAEDLIYIGATPTTDVENITTTKDVTKFILNGQLVVRHGDKLYNMLGQEVK